MIGLICFLGLGIALCIGGGIVYLNEKKRSSVDLAEANAQEAKVLMRDDPIGTSVPGLRAMESRFLSEQADLLAQAARVAFVGGLIFIMIALVQISFALKDAHSRPSSL